MMRRNVIVMSLVVAAFSLPLQAADKPASRAASGPASRPAVVCNVKVLSDKVKDVSTYDAWRKSYLSGKKTDREKALACWETVVAFQHQDAPPNEFLGSEDNVIDPLKVFNVYGYSLCSVAAAEVSQLARVAGLKARGWTINNHCVPEVEFDGAWHMLDASLINYFPKADGSIASVAEICTAVQAWLKDHPELKGDDKALREFQFANDGAGWKRGPDLLTHCPFYDDRGWWPAATHGWYSTMQEYDGSKNTPFAWESAGSTGYQVNIQLREGEVLTRNWSNKGLHVNMDGGGQTPGCLKGVVGKDALRYTPQYGDLAPGRVGNGRLEYNPPMATLLRTAVSAENMVADSGGVHVADDMLPGFLVIRMPSSYVYLNGEMDVKLSVVPHGAYIISYSDNNGLDWQDIARGTSGGVVNVTLPVLRRYDYQVKFELQGKGTGIESMKIGHDIQHSQRALPALDKGDNVITFSAGSQESTVTVEGSLTEDAKGLSYSAFKPAVEGFEGVKIKGAKASMTFPVSTPGDMTRIRAGCFWRAWSADDGFDILVSTDGGKIFKPARAFGKSDNFNYSGIEFTDVPAGTRSAMVKLAGMRKSELQLMAFHINADYRPAAAGFRPVKIRYAWYEGTKEKAKEFTADTPQAKFNIWCDDRPVMKSITLQLAE